MKQDRIQVVILDDYQAAALDIADWSALAGQADVRAITRNIADQADLAVAIGGAEIVVAMRERTPFDDALLSRLPALRLLVTTGMANKSIDLAAASRRGVTVCGTPGSSASAAELA